ncbi:hypothetical protein GCM10007147_40400 [Nocardiopsis kunsanensis]|uniref:DUF1015 domain-containing protein n=1 Tax=Nocardiopsis kunsanensis TaxID=141693 RepID=A0A918XJ71_9ACTN|nr:DUF1015 domain-containing protein [Nocardiopsis kunsanensis]GHD34641.1 hypothetical protein GCM10007147_40400 [Nocardiopsis kunsanensis]
MSRHALDLAPFRGLRYAAPDVDRFIDDGSDVSRLLAPPYDIPDAQEARELQRSDPHNAARVTLPFELTRESHPRYRTAAALLRRWVRNGVLAQDPDPALYVYEQITPDGTHQRGLIGALDLSSPVRPHEDVAEAPVQDRFRLMRATRANLEPIFLLYRGGGGAASRAAQGLPRQPLFTARAGDGSQHSLWALTCPATIAEIRADLAGRSALIADGHHRYAAYRKLHHTEPDPIWHRGLAMLVDSETHPPHLGAIHRVLPGAGTGPLLERARSVARVDPVPTLTPEIEGPGVVLAAPDGSAHLVHGFDEQTLTTHSPDRSARWRHLPTSVLHQVLLPLWGVAEEQVRMVHDSPEGAVAAAHNDNGTAVIVPSLSVNEVYAVADRGELTPRKSTSFGPKPRTGLVMRLLDRPPEEPWSTEPSAHTPP